MKKFLLLVLFLAFNVSKIYSQWNIINVGTSQDLYSVDYYSLNDTWIGSYNKIAQTTTGGASWNIIYLYDNFGLSIQPANMYDLALTSSTNALGTGLFSLGNDEFILNTTNSGTNWNYASSNNSVGLPRTINSVDVSSARAVAVGNNGRIARSTNNGSSWTFVSSGTSNFIYDVKFATYDTLFAAGNNCILKSVNGGASWTLTTMSGGFKTVGCDHGTVYIGNSTTNTMLKSTNYGTSYSTINLPFSYQGVLYAIDKDTVLAAGGDGVYVSRSGGQYWEKYILPSFKTVKMFDFYSLNKGIAVGNAGYAIKTDNLSLAPKIPLSLFSIVGGPTFCIGDYISFTNSTIPGCAYQWQINGTNYSSAYSPSGITLNSAGSQTISLISTNGYGSDTMDIAINVLGHNLINPFTFSASTDTVCDGSSVTFSLPSSQSGVSYQLRKNFVNIGFTLGGTGATLTFNSGAILGTNSFSIRATRSNSCFTDSVVNFKTIYSATAVASTTFYVSRDTVCFNDTASLVIPNSLIGYKYTWYNSTLGTTGTTYFNGNGSTLLIPLSARTATQSFAPKAINISRGCNSIFSPAIFIVADKPLIYFTINNFNPEVGETVYPINNSINPNGYYHWDLGAGASAQFSNAANPGNITYSSLGQQSIKLVATTPFGCKDSLIKKINVLNPFTNDTCNFTQGASTNNGGEGVAMQYDYQNNLIYWYNGESTNKHIAYSNHGDSSVTNLTPIVNYYEYSYFLTKFNSKGIPKWTTKLWHGSTWAKRGDLETDTAGNIYCTYYHAEYADSLRIYSSDDRYITIDPPHSGSYLNSVVVLKYNKDGILQWYNTYLDQYGLERLAMKADNYGNLYVCSDNALNKFNNIGQLVWSKTGSFSDVEIDNQDFIWTNNNAPNNRDIMVQQYDTSGSLIFTSTPLTQLGSVIGSGYLKLDNLNNIYIAGVFSGKFIYNNDTINDPYWGGTVHEDIFLCKMKPNGQQEWFKQFKSDIGSSLKGLDVKNNHIILSITNYGDTVNIANLPPVIFSSQGHFLYHTDSLGSSESTNKLYETTQPYISGGTSATHLICFNRNSNNLSLGFEFNTNFLYSGTTVVPYGTANSVHNFFIGSGTINCLLPNIPSANIPYSHFLSSSSNICIGQSISFTDLSSMSPTAWNWSFPGGTPSSSSSQNPTITFNTQGIYSVSLIASNGFGDGTPYSASIHVDVCTGIQSVSDFNQTIISPNPSRGKFKIEMENEQLKGEKINLEIYNVMGEKIYYSTVQQLNNTKIDISEKPNGIYLLIISSDKEKKIIKIQKF